MVTSGLQPSAGMRCLSAQRFALGWIISPFQGSFCNQHSAISRANKSTTKQINISTIQQLTASAGFTRAESPNYFSPIPQGWGISTSGPCSEGWKPELNSFLFLLLRNLGLKPRSSTPAKICSSPLFPASCLSASSHSSTNGNSAYWHAASLLPLPSFRKARYGLPSKVKNEEWRVKSPSRV